jgi:glucose-6-phosphate isomerase
MKNSSGNVCTYLIEKFIDLDKLPVYHLLQDLSRRPVNLTANGVLTPERIAAFVCRNDWFNLLYATERVDDAILDALQQLADQSSLVEKFLAMKQGAVLNRIEGFSSENRQVLHTSCRDVFSNTPHEPATSAQAKKELEKLRLFLADLQKGAIVNAQGAHFTDLVHIGFGGSDLGPLKIYLPLAACRQP